MTTLKLCTSCGKEKQLSEFGWKNKLRGRLRSECKSCHNEETRRYKADARTRGYDFDEEIPRWLNVEGWRSLGFSRREIEAFALASYFRARGHNTDNN